MLLSMGTGTHRSGTGGRSRVRRGLTTTALLLALAALPAQRAEARAPRSRLPTALRRSYRPKTPAERRAIEALDLSRYPAAVKAARKLGEMGSRAAVVPLVALLDKPLAIKSRANLAKLAAIRALARIGDRRAVPGLIRALLRDPSKQDFFLNKIAARALGQLGDPRAVGALIQALFMSSTIQGTSYPYARLALVRIGQAAIAPLLRAYDGKHAAVEAMRRRLRFRPGVVRMKAAIVVGAIGSTRAVAPLLERLRRIDRSRTAGAGLIEALGRIGSRRATKALLALLADKKANYKLRMQVCAALTLIGDPRALGPLLVVAEHGTLPGGYTNLREAAVLAYARIAGGGAQGRRGVAKLAKMAADPKLRPYRATRELFESALARAKLGLRCAARVRCYAKVLLDAKQPASQREKAALMIGLAPRRARSVAVSTLIKALPTKEQVLRLYLLAAARRVATRRDKALLATLRRLYRRDAKRRKRFLGADLARADATAIAVIARKR